MKYKGIRRCDALGTSSSLFLFLFFIQFLITSFQLRHRSYEFFLFEMIRFGSFNFDLLFGLLNENCITICFDMTKDYLFVYFKMRIHFFWLILFSIRSLPFHGLKQFVNVMFVASDCKLSRRRKTSFIHSMPKDLYVLCSFNSDSVTKLLQYFFNYVCWIVCIVFRFSTVNETCSTTVVHFRCMYTKLKQN